MTDRTENKYYKYNKEKTMKKNITKKYHSAKNFAHRFNNRSITWTKMQRQMLEETLEEYGYHVDRCRSGKIVKTDLC